MKCSKFRAIKEVLGFLEAALMGCFFACFRIKGDEDRRNVRLSTNSIPSKNRDPLVSKNQFDAVILCEEKESPCGQVLRPSLQEDFDEDSISGDLEHEAKYLKSCGALLETPAEIRKASGKIIVQTPEENGVHMDFHSLLPAASCKKLQWNEQLNLISDSLTQVDNSDFLEHKSGGCNSDDHQTSTKFVHCEENKHYASAVESNVEAVMLDISPSKSDSKVAVLGSNDSPYPTPLNLTDEMQTPGTVFPNNQENLRTRKSSRICRMQYVYPVLKPVENLPHWNTLREDTSLSQSAENPEQEKKIHCPDYRGRTQQISLAPAPMDSKLFESQRFSSPNDRTIQVQDTVSREESVHDKSLSSPTSLFNSGELLNSNVDTPSLVIASLSQWPKPPLPKDDIGNNNFTTEKTHSEKSYGTSKPIMGIDTDELSHISPKWWDGNGIPNTTNKYKEDQKVSWHATPFEERLKKALSDEKLIPKRKLPDGRPIELEDDG